VFLSTCASIINAILSVLDLRATRIIQKICATTDIDGWDLNFSIPAAVCPHRPPESSRRASLSADLLGSTCDSRHWIIQIKKIRATTKSMELKSSRRTHGNPESSGPSHADF
jgi:hypothetical protein